MSYKRTYWSNGSVSINADRMNNIELGILEIESELNKLKVARLDFLVLNMKLNNS